MDYRESPTVWYKGDERYPPQFGKKICIDWSKNKIRMSLILSSEHRHPNIKKEIQTYVEWLDLGHPLLDFFYFDGIIDMSKTKWNGHYETCPANDGGTCTC